MKTINLTKGEVALVDDDRYAWLNVHNWYITSYGYAQREYKENDKRTRQFMHRSVIGAKAGEIVDHINGNKLDNRISNLRIVTKAQSNQNRGVTKLSRSGYKGVHFDARSRLQPWYAMIETNGKAKNLGYFKTREEAAKAYNEAAFKAYGAYARLNSL